MLRDDTWVIPYILYCVGAVAYSCPQLKYIKDAVGSVPYIIYNTYQRTRVCAGNYTLCLLSRNMKNGPPMMEVMIPTGISTGCINVLPKVSAAINRIAPSSAE